MNLGVLDTLPVIEEPDAATALFETMDPFAAIRQGVNPMVAAFLQGARSNRSAVLPPYQPSGFVPPPDPARRGGKKAEVTKLEIGVLGRRRLLLDVAVDGTFRKAVPRVKIEWKGTPDDRPE